jgi:hypothetical protein
MHEALAPVAEELVIAERQREQPHAAVDVVADAAGGDHPISGIRGRHATDGKAVPLMDVGHGKRGVDDAGQRGHVCQQLERAVLLDRSEQLGVGEHPRGHAHARDRADGELPQLVVDAARLIHRGPRGQSIRPQNARTPAGGR